MTKLTGPEIKRLVYKYIGVEGGYLCGFSYSIHSRFYLEYCDLDIDVEGRRGKRKITTRDLFIEILEDCRPYEQAKILRGILDMLPPEEDEDKKKNEPQVLKWISRLESGIVPVSKTITITYDSVRRALDEAEKAIAAGNAVGAIDRTHTALHGYAKQKCLENSIQLNSNESLPAVFKHLKALSKFDSGLVKILNSLGSVIHELNELRNQKSLAHPNPSILGGEEAHLAVNSARTLLAYLHAKLK